MLLDKLAETGVDINATLERFLNNKGMYQKFLKKFLNDTNYQGYMENIANNDYEAAQKSIHTLKGVSANLGLTPIFDITNTLNAKLRANDTAGLDELNEQLTAAYTNIINLIKEYGA